MDNTPAPPQRSTLKLNRPLERKTLQPTPTFTRGAAVPQGNTELKADSSLFHFVWCVGRRAPRKRHATLDAAVAESERLAAANPGLTYNIYTATLAGTKRVKL